MAWGWEEKAMMRGAVVEFDEADFDFVGEAGGRPSGSRRGTFMQSRVGDDGAGEIVELGEVVAEAKVFEGAGIIFGGKEVVAIFKAEAFTNVFEGIGVGPADADGFFGKGEGLKALGVDGVLGLDPVDLIGQEVFAEHGVGVDFDGGEDGAHEFSILDFDFRLRFLNFDFRLPKGSRGDFRF